MGHLRPVEGQDLGWMMLRESLIAKNEIGSSRSRKARNGGQFAGRGRVDQ